MGVLAAIMGLVVLAQIGAGLWLAVLGQWVVVGYGLVLLFLGALAIGLLQMPGAKLVAMAEVRYSRPMTALGGALRPAGAGCRARPNADLG